MDRRDLLKAGLFTVGLSAMGRDPARAEGEASGLLAEMTDDRPWLDEAVFTRLRSVARILAHLRITYVGPNGYEDTPAFVAGIWRELEIALGRSAEFGHRVNVPAMTALLDGPFGARLRGEMSDLFAANGEHFTRWMREIGIAPDAALERDFLRAQALFAIGAAGRHHSQSLTPFRDHTWIYPFC